MKTTEVFYLLGDCMMCEAYDSDFYNVELRDKVQMLIIYREGEEIACYKEFHHAHYKTV